MSLALAFSLSLSTQSPFSRITGKMNTLLLLLCLIGACCASVYEVPLAKAVIVQHVDSDLLHPYDDDHLPAVVLPSPKQKVYVPAQSLVHHPALATYHYPGKKYTIHFPSGIYHGPHGVGVYDPKFHDELEQAYYSG